MMQKRSHDEAVSPVVGVMLMLVVTIIIAAIVAAFASGLGGGMSSTPTAVFTADNIVVDEPGWAGDTMSSLNLIHKGGDTISLAEISVVTEAYGTTKTYTAANGGLTSLYGSNAIGPNDAIHVNTTGSGSAAGTPISWSIIDSISGNKIASGKFVVP